MNKLEELINKTILFFNELFNVENLNSDFYPGNYIEITQNNKTELIKYE